MSSGDSLRHSPLLTSVSPPRFSEPEREGLRPAGCGDSDSEDRREDMQEMSPRKLYDQGAKGISASLDPPFWSKSALGGGGVRKGQDYYYSSRQARKIALREGTGIMTNDKGKPVVSLSLFQSPLRCCFLFPGVVSDSASTKPTLAAWPGGLPYTLLAT